jgi:hypothetical protein
MRLREARIRRACCPVQAGPGEAPAPERVDVNVVDTLPCNCKVAPSPLVMRSKTGVGWSSKRISMVTWQRKYPFWRQVAVCIWVFTVDRGRAYACTR